MAQDRITVSGQPDPSHHTYHDYSATVLQFALTCWQAHEAIARGDLNVVMPPYCLITEVETADANKNGGLDVSCRLDLSILAINLSVKT